MEKGEKKGKRWGGRERQCCCRKREATADGMEIASQGKGIYYSRRVERGERRQKRGEVE